MNSKSDRIRVVGGALGGRRLHVPPGLATRPTSERAREALFNILAHATPPLAGARFLDLFAGSGAVGIEAASRGAAHVLCIDNDRGAAHAIAHNIEALAIGDRVSLLVVDATALPRCQDPFDVVFLDPPYAAGTLPTTLVQVIERGWLAADGRLVCETAAGNRIDIPEPYVVEDERRYGAACFHFLRLHRR